MDLFKGLSVYNSLMIPSDLQTEVQIPEHGLHEVGFHTLSLALSLWWLILRVNLDGPKCRYIWSTIILISTKDAFEWDVHLKRKHSNKVWITYKGLYISNIWDLMSLEISKSLQNYRHNPCCRHSHHLQKFPLHLCVLRILHIRSTLSKIFLYIIQNH